MKNEMVHLLNIWRWEIERIEGWIQRRENKQLYKTIHDQISDMDFLKAAKEEYRKAETMLKSLVLEIEKMEKRIKERKRTQYYKTIEDERYAKSVLKESINLYNVSIQVIHPDVENLRSFAMKKFGVLYLGYQGDN
jgi:hypothetical protein